MDFSGSTFSKSNNYIIIPIGVEFHTHKLSVQLKTVDLLSYEEMGGAFIATFIIVYYENQDSKISCSLFLSSY